MVVGREVMMLVGECLKMRPDPAGAYREHFKKVTGYNGPLSQWNSNHIRPVEFHRIGWIKVSKEQLEFQGGNSPKGPESTGAAEVFYLFESNSLCPPRKNRFINSVTKYPEGRIWLSYDQEDQVLWFLDELAPFTYTPQEWKTEDGSPLPGSPP